MESQNLASENWKPKNWEVKTRNPTTRASIKLSNKNWETEPEKKNWKTESEEQKLGTKTNMQKPKTKHTQQSTSCSLQQVIKSIFRWRGGSVQIETCGINKGTRGTNIANTPCFQICDLQQR